GQVRRTDRLTVVTAEADVPNGRPFAANVVRPNTLDWCSVARVTARARHGQLVEERHILEDGDVNFPEGLRDVEWMRVEIADVNLIGYADAAARCIDKRILMIECRFAPILAAKDEANRPAWKRKELARIAVDEAEDVELRLPGRFEARRAKISHRR